MEVTYIPKTIDECFEFLEKNLQDLEVFKNTNEEQMRAQAHMFLGRWLRNNWNLWWSEELYNQVKKQRPDYPSEKPELVKWFNDLGIDHPDDMSSVIITSFHRKINNKPINLEDQINYFVNP